MAFLQRYLTHTARGLAFVAALLLAQCSPPSTAQAQPAATKEPTRSLRFYYLGFTGSDSKEGDPDAMFLIRNGRADLPLLLNANSFSATIDYAGETPVALFREKHTETGVERETIGRFAFPAEWRGALILVTRDPANALLPFRFYPVEYWAPSVPDQKVRIINLCAYPLAAKIGSTQSTVAARETRDAPLPLDLADVPLRLAVQRADRWERLLSTAIARPAQNKLALIVYPKPDGGARVLIVKDLPSPPPAPQPKSP